MNGLFLAVRGFFIYYWHDFHLLFPFILFKLTIFSHSVALNWHFSSHVCIFFLNDFDFNSLFSLCFLRPFWKYFFFLFSFMFFLCCLLLWCVTICCMRFWNCFCMLDVLAVRVWHLRWNRQLNRLPMCCALWFHSCGFIVLFGCIFNRSHPQVDCTWNIPIFPRRMEYIWLYCDRIGCCWVGVGRCTRPVGATCFSFGK